MGRASVLAASLLALAVTAAAPAPRDAPAEAKSLDATLYHGLRDVINRGVDLYRMDDPAACYRLYEGSLMTIRPLLEHKPELQKAIDRGLAGARRDPLMWRRAFTLRSVLDKVRAELNPKKDLLHKPRAEEGKKDEEKKAAPKDEPKDKKGEPNEKKDEQKDDNKDN